MPTRWPHQMKVFSALLALCVGNSPVTGEFPSQRAVTRSFDIFFDLCLNKRLSKQSSGWWFETPLCSLWRHCNESRLNCRDTCTSIDSVCSVLFFVCLFFIKNDCWISDIYCTCHNSCACISDKSRRQIHIVIQHDHTHKKLIMRPLEYIDGCGNSGLPFYNRD